MSSNDLAIKHVLLRLRPINRSLRTAVTLQAAKAARLDQPDLKPLCVTDAHVAALLADVDEFVRGIQETDLPSAALTAEEEQIEQHLRVQAQAQQLTLPVDMLHDTLHLTPFEVDALLICAASELHPGYERIFGYILDDLNRRFPCVELLSNLNSTSTQQRLARRSELGPAGRLRRSGLLQPFGETTTSARTQLRLAESVLEFLLGSSPAAVGIWRDADEIEIDNSGGLVTENDVRIQRIGAALADGTVGIVGLWGPEDASLDSAAQMIAQAARKPLRRLRVTPDANHPTQHQIRSALQTAASRGAILLVETDSFRDVEFRASPRR